MLIRSSEDKIQIHTNFENFDHITHWLKCFFFILQHILNHDYWESNNVHWIMIDKLYLFRYLAEVAIGDAKTGSLKVFIFEVRSRTSYWIASYSKPSCQQYSDIFITRFLKVKLPSCKMHYIWYLLINDIDFTTNT